MADQNEDSVLPKSQIIMKVDAPPEENIPEDNLDNNINNKMDSTQTNTALKAKIPTTSSFNNSNAFALRTSILGQPKLSSGFVLRPSALGVKVDSKPEEKTNTFALNPNRINPFGKPETEEGIKSENKDSNGSPEVKFDTNTSELPKFVPLGASNTENKQSTSSNNVTPAPNFVFGQNIHERIVAENENSSESNNAQAGPSTSHTNANGTSELLFSSAVKNSNPTSDTNKEVKTLTESAREYEESRANKRKYEEVTVVTGEEDEKNVMQINCKLFAFDKATGNWQERGRGTLRLNDKEVTNERESTIQSRLVIRTTGSLRVVLNTKIWAEMTVDLASPKSLRLTAMDSSGIIKVFLIMANPEEIKQLHRLLDVRVNNEVRRHKQQEDVVQEPDCKKPAVKPLFESD